MLLSLKIIRSGRDGPVRSTPAKLPHTLPLIDGGGLAGRLHLVPQSVQVGVFGRSLAAS